MSAELRLGQYRNLRYFVRGTRHHSARLALPGTSGSFGLRIQDPLASSVGYSVRRCQPDRANPLALHHILHAARVSNRLLLPRNVDAQAVRID
jgi:hypothetical protein